MLNHMINQSIIIQPNTEVKRVKYSKKSYYATLKMDKMQKNDVIASPRILLLKFPLHIYCKKVVSLCVYYVHMYANKYTQKIYIKMKV